MFSWCCICLKCHDVILETMLAMLTMLLFLLHLMMLKGAAVEDCLFGVVIKASASRAEDPGIESHL